MPRLSISERERVIALHSRGMKVPDIFRRMQLEDVDITLRAVYNLVKKYTTKGMCIRNALVHFVSHPLAIGGIKFSTPRPGA